MPCLSPGGSYTSVDECQIEFSRVPKVLVLEERTTSVSVWNLQILRRSDSEIVECISHCLGPPVSHACNKHDSRLTLDANEEAPLTIQCLLQKVREVSAELSRTMWFKVSAMLWMSHLHHVARAARKVEIDVPMSQMVQADTSTVLEWLN